MNDDPGSSSWIFQVLLLFVLILVNAYFAMSEIAIISLNDNKIKQMAEEGNKKAKQVLKLTANSSNFLSTIQIGVTLAGFLTSASASQVFAERLTSVLRPVLPNSISTGLINGFAILVITLITSYFSLVLGELVPKRIAMSNPEKISFLAVGFLTVFAKVTKPIVKVLSVSTNLVVRLFGIDPNKTEDPLTEEEIRMMVNIGRDEGVIEGSQEEMIINIFEFDDIDVADIMTHRTDIYAANIDSTVQDVVEISKNAGYSRIPVFEEDLDNIVGIAYIKDLIQYIGKDLPKDLKIRNIMRPAFYVPETKRAGELFNEMSESHIQMAIAVDEYGGTAGIVTLEDLLESIVGNIQDEYDQEIDEITHINDTTYLMEGTLDLEKVEDCLDTQFPEDDYDTLGGFIISELGFLPQDGDMNTVEYGNFRFTVLSVEDRRIERVKVEILPDPDAEDDNEKDKKDEAKKKDKE